MKNVYLYIIEKNLMKILRFNENKNTDFIDSFTDAIGINLHEWISEISKNTKLKEYSIINTYNIPNAKKTIKFAEQKNFQYLKKFAETEIEIYEMEKKMKKLRKFLDNKLYFNVGNEIMYNFQLELLEKDFQSFYNYFIKSNIEDKIEYPEINIFEDIHPKILNNPKYRKIIELQIDISKYNI